MLLWDDDEPLEELAAINDADELCRQLLGSGGGWGSSTRHAEAVELLANVHGSGELPASLVALLLCTCRRWHRVTAKLIVAIEDSGLLADADLDELSRWCLEHGARDRRPAGVAVAAVARGSTWRPARARSIPSTRTRGPAPRPVRAAAEAVGGAACAAHRPGPLQRLQRSADVFEPRRRDALIDGLLDAADALDVAARRALVRRGLRAARSGVRRTALDLLCELDGPDKARRRASADTSATVRAWRPRSEPAHAPSLLDAA